MKRNYWIIFSFLAIFLMAGTTHAETCPLKIKDPIKRCAEAKKRLEQTREFGRGTWTPAKVAACCRTGRSTTTRRPVTTTASSGSSFSKEEFEEYLAKKYSLKDSGGAISWADVNNILTNAVLLLLGIGLGVLIFGIFLRQYIRSIRKIDSTVNAVLNALRKPLLTEEEVQSILTIMSPDEKMVTELARIFGLTEEDARSMLAIIMSPAEKGMAELARILGGKQVLEDADLRNLKP